MAPFKLLPYHSGHSNLTSKFAKRLKHSVEKNTVFTEIVNY